MSVWPQTRTLFCVASSLNGGSLSLWHLLKLEYRYGLEFSSKLSHVCINSCNSYKQNATNIWYQEPSAIDPLNITAMACPALPLCPLAVTEAERGMPQILERVRAVLKKVNLAVFYCPMILKMNCIWFSWCIIKKWQGSFMLWGNWNSSSFLYSEVQTFVSGWPWKGWITGCEGNWMPKWVR